MQADARVSTTVRRLFGRLDCAFAVLSALPFALATVLAASSAQASTSAPQAKLSCEDAFKVESSAQPLSQDYDSIFKAYFSSLGARTLNHAEIFRQLVDLNTMVIGMQKESPASAHLLHIEFERAFEAAKARGVNLAGFWDAARRHLQEREAAHEALVLEQRQSIAVAEKLERRFKPWTLTENPPWEGRSKVFTKISWDGSILSTTIADNAIDDPQLEFYDPQTGVIYSKQKVAPREPPRIVANLAAKIFAQFNGAAIEVRNLANGSLAFPIEPSNKWDFEHAAFSQDGARLAVASESHIALYNTRTRLRETEVIFSTADAVKVTAIALSPNGNRLAAILANESIQVWDIQSSGLNQKTILKPASQYRFNVSIADRWGSRFENDNDLSEIQFNKDGSQVLVYSRNRAAGPGQGIARVINLLEKKVVRLSDEKDPIVWTSFSPNKKWILTLSSDGKARIWNAKSGLLHKTLDPTKYADSPEKPMVGLEEFAAFSPDGSLVLMSQDNGKIGLWNVESEERIATLHAPDARFSRALFTRDGHHIVAETHAGQVFVWSPD